MDFPAPQIDDLFFVGTPVHLANGGGYSNPWVALPDWFKGAAYHFHPPFHARLMGLWLGVAGISTSSCLLFAAISHWLTTVGITVWLRACGKSPAWVWLFVPPVLGFGAAQGLRQDPWGVALLVLGSGLVLRNTLPAWLAGFFLLGAAPLFSPVVAAYGGVLSLVVGGMALWRSWPADPQRARGHVGAKVAMVGLAALLNALLFLAGIDFALGDFLHNFGLVARHLRGPASSAIPWFFGSITAPWRVATDFPFVVSSLFLVGAIWWRWATASPLLRIASVGMPLGILGTIALYQASTTHPPLVCALAGIGMVLGGAVTGRLRQLALVGYMAMGLLHVALPCLRLVAVEPVRPEFIAGLRQQVSAAGEFRWAVDTCAARYVFGYQLPAKAMAWEFLYPLPKFNPTGVADRQPGWAWMVSRDTLAFRWPSSGIRSEPVHLAGRTFGSLPRYRDDLLVFGSSTNGF